MYTEGSGAFAQIVRIAAISPWAFIGFENISHFSEEYRFPVKKVRGILIWSVVITTLLGLAYFRVLIRRDQDREYGKSMVVWIILPVLVLFASMMWVSRA